MPPSPKSR
ncbi:hypothetical protein D039_0479A, partial [Vibrio parahaemolyticus EKP-028]